MNHDELIELLAEHQKKIFPEFPDNEAFAEWVDELFEVDDYYVGLMTSIIDGHPEDIDKNYIETLKMNFAVIVPDKADQNIHRQCVTYLESLELLVKSLEG